VLQIFGWCLLVGHYVLAIIQSIDANDACWTSGEDNLNKIISMVQTGLEYNRLILSVWAYYSHKKVGNATCVTTDASIVDIASQDRYAHTLDDTLLARVTQHARGDGFDI
jgi:hypothetical protein